MCFDIEIDEAEILDREAMNEDGAEGVILKTVPVKRLTITDELEVGEYLPVVLYEDTGYLCYEAKKEGGVINVAKLTKKVRELCEMIKKGEI